MVSSLRRHRASTVLVGLEAFVAVGAVFGSVELVLDGPHFLGDTVETNQLPYSSWTLAGVALLLVNGLVPALAVLAERRHDPDARTLHVVAGVALMLWITLQLMTIGLVFVLQPLMFGVGAVIVAVAATQTDTR